mgnify:CR=1 FL=1
MIDFNNNNFINLCYNYDKEYKISKSDYIFDFPDVYKNYKVIIIDNSFDFIPINFFRKKQFTTDFMEYLVSTNLILNILVNKFLLYGNIWIYDQKSWTKKTQSFDTWLNNLGKEGYELVHCEYLISEEGQLCIFKKEK